MRHEFTSDDEKRLFPSYVKKNGGVPIVPGQTVAVAATKKTKPGQQFSNKPVDRISQNSKQSGPFRARGKKSNTPKELLTAIDDASRTGHAPNFEASDRPAKRQRRNSQPAPSNVYSFSDNDDVMEQIAPISSTPPVLELSSHTSPSRKHTGNRAWEPNEDTIPESVPSDSDHDELFTENAAKERLSSASDIIASHSKGLNQAPRPGILQSVEVEGPKVAPKLKAITSPSVSNRRRSTSGSSDELQGAVTVPPVPSTLPLRKEDVSSALRSSPSDIRSTTFSPSASKNKKGRKKRRRVSNEQIHQLIEPYRSFEASQVQFGTVQLRPSSEKAVEVNLDTNRLWVVGNTPDSSLQQEISLRQIMQVIYGEDTSCKIRLGLSKTEGQCNQMDIELITPEVKDELFHLLQILPIKLKYKPSEWMDRTFKNTEREFICFSNRLKRPSIDSVSEPVPEPETETPKRPKISESLQVDDRTTVPSNDTDDHPSKSADVPTNERNESDDTAHAHPTRVSTSNSVEIPVMKYSPPVPPNNRQTRSTTHRADPEPATVICDDDDGNGNDSAPQPPARTFAKWEKPLLYPRFGKKKAEVDAQDRERLRSDEFLNDNLIGFYMRFLEDHLERTNKDAAKRVYFFNSYFYATLTNNPKNRRVVNYESVQKWTRSVDIFSYDYIVVPINESAHWYVAVICNLPNLQRILKKSSEADKPPSNDSQEPASQPEGEVQAVPDTPVSSQEVAQGQWGLEEQKANPEPAKEETARQSMAAMTLHDKTETNDRGAQEIPASDEDWPEKAENPNTSPVKFTSPPKTRSGAQQTSEDAPKPTAPSQKSKKSKKKSRGPRNARDARDPLDPVIITFDSLNLARSPTIRNLRQYLSEEAQSKKGIDVDTTLVGGLRARSIPLQSNYSDCGLYLLAYVEKFVQDPDGFVSKLLRGEMDERTDWPPLSSGALRQRLRRFLDDLYDEQEQLSRGELGEKRVMADMRPISFLLGEGKPEPAKEGGKPDTDAPQTKPSPAPEKASPPPEKASSYPEKASSQPEKTTEPFPLFLPPAEPENPPEEAPETKASATGPFQPLSLSFSPGTPTRTGKHKGAHPSKAVRSIHTEQRADGDIVEVPNSQEPEPGVLDLTSPQKKTGIQPPVAEPEKKDDNAVTVDDDNVAVKANPPAPSNDGKKEKEVEVQISGTPPPSLPKETKSAKKKRRKLVVELGGL
ncbi:uncharacterized protein ASPGLDRAFT_466781 [Aspergillus glaucus CBS 516.65]|uniref:Ubiquitin-like protease family profile domain-containing protein n=1 Tax=Aspergillus glaucus CBS 516.65 TaxID=1160497 RepID=A0A1L9VH42_ASPGL|nr:hypothetical protein ASPGLDRAFT_466781 [Aspergillus glaucus CBS 516.65]OJJ83185.1 hypothetical protein ASPGLDRAFT_466781 [Aspergillus glaucus CBS 516.65]